MSIIARVKLGSKQKKDTVMRHKSGSNRHQLQIISLDQMAEKTAMVRIIDAFVEMLNMQQF